MDLSPFAQWVIDQHPDDPSSWCPVALREYLAAKGFPEIVAVNAEAGMPFPLLPAKPTAAGKRREQQRLKALRQHTELETERKRLLDRISPPNANLWDVLDDADQVSRRVEVSKVTARDVSAYLRTTIIGVHTFGHEPDTVGSLIDSRPSGWINPLPTSMSLTMPPESIVIDVTYSTRADLGTIWPQVEEARKRLGIGTAQGGRYAEDDDDEMAFMNQLYEHRTGLDKPLTWKKIADRVNEKFGLDLDAVSASARLRTWRKSHGLPRCNRHGPIAIKSPHR